MDVQGGTYLAPVAEGMCSEGKAVLYNLAVGIQQHVDGTRCDGYVLTRAEEGRIIDHHA